MKPHNLDNDMLTLLSERYRNFERIGEGGTAVVYKAEDLTLLRTVAIKTMSIATMTPDMVLRFQHEARAASKLQHPNLITVLDFGLTEKSRPYLVMDFVEGKSLEDVLQEQDFLSIEQTISIALEVCRGMAFAHQSGVVHRDLKPSNILLLNTPEPDARVKVVDFGIAKLSENSVKGSIARDIDGCTADRPASTSDGSPDAVQKCVALERKNQGESKSRTGELMGSPFYISPEQIRGDEVDQRADIYSLGCIMFRMLSGTAPFEGETHLETYSQHLNDQPPMIVDPVLPAEMHTLLDRCLAKNPSDRPSTMTEVAESLRLIQMKLSAAPAEKSVDELDKKIAKRGFIAVTACGVILLLATVFINWQKTEEKPARSDAKQSQNSVSHVKWSIQTDLDGSTFWQASQNATDDDIDYIVSMNEKSISLRQTKITHVALQKLAASPVEVLDLSSTNLDNSAVPYIAKLKNLTSLTLDSTKIDDKGLKELAPLKNLMRLDLDQLDGITDDGIDTIVKQWPNLEYLNIARARVTEEGLLRLPELKHLRGLELAELTLSDKVMAALMKMDNIWELNLNHSTFSRKWVFEFPKMRGLRLLMLTNVKSLSPDDYARLKTELIARGKSLKTYTNANGEIDDVQPIIEMMGIDGPPQ